MPFFSVSGMGGISKVCFGCLCGGLSRFVLAVYTARFTYSWLPWDDFIFSLTVWQLSLHLTLAGFLLIFQLGIF